MTIEGGLWARRQATNRDAALPHGYRMLEKAGNLENLRIAAGRSSGRYQGPVFMDSDVYKWIEAAAYEHARMPSDWLLSHMAAAIDIVGAAQGEDGYLNSHYQVAEPGRRWTDFAQGHELYCAGHLFQAAVAHHRATGDDRLLRIARRFADYLDARFGPGKEPGTPGHPEIEMGLTELYRETRERRYLDLAGFFLDQRGRAWLGPGRYNSAAYYQDRVPVREAAEVEGHAVRALYLTAGVADVYLETREAALLAALDRQWADLTSRKLYVTGGVGSRHLGEAFGQPYELPNDLAYCETCAAIASILWSWRMLLATGQVALRRPDRPDAPQRRARRRVARRRALLLREPPGQQRAGRAPRARRAAGERSGIWSPAARRTSCGSWRRSGTTSRRAIARASRCTSTRRPGSRPSWHRGAPWPSGWRRRYPWEGSVRLTVEEGDGSAWPLALRIPEWCGHATVRVNGGAVDARPDAGGLSPCRAQLAPGRRRGARPPDRREADRAAPGDRVDARVASRSSAARSSIASSRPIRATPRSPSSRSTRAERRPHAGTRLSSRAWWSSGRPGSGSTRRRGATGCTARCAPGHRRRAGGSSSRPFRTSPGRTEARAPCACGSRGLQSDGWLMAGRRLADGSLTAGRRPADRAG